MIYFSSPQILLNVKKLSTRLKLVPNVEKTSGNSVTKKQRDVILLCYFQGLNDREIAELYHVSRSAISSRRNRGLQKLKMLLTERK